VTHSQASAPFLDLRNPSSELPGIGIADISPGEGGATRSRSADSNSLSQLPPLAPAAASVLLGRPGLDRNAVPGSDRSNLPSGLRMFRLAVPGRRRRTVPGPGGRPRPRRLSRVSVVLDCPGDPIRLVVFLEDECAEGMGTAIRPAVQPF
jgi:hypothetical protein